MLISSFNTYIEMAASLNGLIFDAVYGSSILSLPLFTLVEPTHIAHLPIIYSVIASG